MRQWNELKIHDAGFADLGPANMALKDMEVFSALRRKRGNENTTET